MDKLRIVGGKPLHGTIRIAGAKNAALPLMAACLLSERPVRLRNLPYLADIVTMGKLLRQHGVTFHMHDAGERGREITLHAEKIDNLTAPYDIVRTMRASVLVLGPLLARFGKARVSLPGGCAIGTRPVDLHLKALEAMGAEIDVKEGYLDAKAPQGLKGGDFTFPQVSVGATENALMAAVLADGTTRLSNAAREPEIRDLAHLLQAMGAQIEGIDTSELIIHGVTQLHAATHDVLPDRIEAGSYLAIAAMTGGELTLEHCQPDDMRATLAALEQTGLHTQIDGTTIRTLPRTAPLQPVHITTEPHPGFPTDMQAQLMAVLCCANGTSQLTETIFENRYMHVPELARMGADITVKGQMASITGVEKLTGAEVMATDLRASLSLVIAALVAEGETIINRVYHLDRGYERLEDKLKLCGADIERMH
ncbi:MAG: UDP-N-acetylglucosamine 1-carboxyvinyltransferase [Rickettsiales bacterium]|nr:UDP-N-acetylglucosamine 1-carboxyvinyltransferase [Rickettsiales bacterium]|tara:strand:+ start:1437 stop:2708 length:1272 start_codon:yes stop_codon:yes gene_type:complete